ncbi:MAG TPA: hypothetical protein VGI39_10170 [Polyangiaceae bacterium]
MTASPGAAGVFVFTSDVFVLPRGARQREGAIDLLQLFGSAYGQSVFSRIKGSLPARRDAAIADRRMDAAWLDFDAATAVPTLTSLVPPAFSGAVDRALNEFVRSRSTGDVLAVIAREYPALSPLRR